MTNIELTEVAPEVSVEEGITRVQNAISTTQQELILLQSQCVGNPKLQNILQAASNLTTSLSVYGQSITREGQKLLQV